MNEKIMKNLEKYCDEILQSYLDGKDEIDRQKAQFIGISIELFPTIKKKYGDSFASVRVED